VINYRKINLLGDKSNCTETKQLQKQITRMNAQIPRFPLQTVYCINYNPTDVSCEQFKVKKALLHIFVHKSSSDFYLDKKKISAMSQ